MSKKLKPFLAHSELTDCIYIIDGNDKYEVTEQCIKAMKATNRMATADDVLDKVRAEIDRQEKWLMSAGYNAYNVDIAFNSIKSVLSESEE